MFDPTAIIIIGGFFIIGILIYLRYHANNESDKNDFKSFIDNINDKKYLSEHINKRILEGKIILINHKMNYSCVNVHIKDKLIFSGIKIPTIYLLVPECRITIISEVPRVNTCEEIPKLEYENVEWIGKLMYYRNKSNENTYAYAFEHKQIRVSDVN